MEGENRVPPPLPVMALYIVVLCSAGLVECRNPAAAGAASFELKKEGTLNCGGSPAERLLGLLWSQEPEDSPEHRTGVIACGSRAVLSLHGNVAKTGSAVGGCHRPTSADLVFRRALKGAPAPVVLDVAQVALPALQGGAEAHRPRMRCPALPDLV
ncbi:hypothetical protein C8Q80DRAFT_1265776 [Daedaleopsis nitida]|nr:hypothetical protein C8Q80DRAFT_1265776 [Daedaleopsis nitida]